MDEFDGIQVRPGLIIPENELVFTTIRASGPGGQNINKRSTKVRLKWWPASSTAAREGLLPAQWLRLLTRSSAARADDGAVQVTSQAHRTQEANKDECRRKLASLIRSWIATPKKRVRTKPTRASRDRRIKEKKRRGDIKKQRREPDGN